MNNSWIPSGFGCRILFLACVVVALLTACSKSTVRNIDSGPISSDGDGYLGQQALMVNVSNKEDDTNGITFVSAQLNDYRQSPRHGIRVAYATLPRVLSGGGLLFDVEFDLLPDARFWKVSIISSEENAGNVVAVFPVNDFPGISFLHENAYFISIQSGDSRGFEGL